MSRIIKFLPDTGSILKIEAPDNLTVGQFIQLLTEQGGQFSLEKNLLTEKKTKATYLTADAVLLDGDISLFSTIKDPKGNNTLSRSEIYSKIQGFISKDGDKAKNHFNKNGNYTRTSSEDLIKLLNSYKGSNSSSKASVSKTPAKVEKKATKSLVSKTSSKSSGSDKDEENELRAAQRSFNPKLTRSK